MKLELSILLHGVICLCYTSMFGDFRYSHVVYIVLHVAGMSVNCCVSCE